MSMIYSKKQNIVQKKEASSASSVFDASSQSESLQRKADMANSIIQCTRSKSRPQFSRKNKNAFHGAVKEYHKKKPHQRIHLCHRVSWRDISQLFGCSWKSVKDKIIALTVPSRDYGNMKKGDMQYYYKVKNVYRISKKIDRNVLKLLNDSPINLRPADAHQNVVNGAKFDGCLENPQNSRGRSWTRQTSCKRSLTPNSEKMADAFGYTECQSSDLSDPTAKEVYEDMVTK